MSNKRKICYGDSMFKQSNTVDQTMKKSKVMLSESKTSMPNNTVASINHKKCLGSNNWHKFLETVQQQKRINKSDSRAQTLADHSDESSKPKSKSHLKESNITSRLQPQLLQTMSNEVCEMNNAKYNKNTAFQVVQKDRKISTRPTQNIKLNSKNNTGLIKTSENPFHSRNTQFQPKNLILTKQIAMDCEMVGVEIGVNKNMLARVSLVSAQGECIYDKYVKPTEPVVDYRTRVSGIRPKDLENAEDFSIVQKEVAEIIKGRILVGHALKNDLSVLFLTHPKRSIRDTSKFKKFREGTTPALKKLAKKYLGVTIQNGEHSSVQDALAAMQLYRMFRKEWEASLWSTTKDKKTLKT